MSFSRRRLPHWQPSDKDLFLTWHLHGSLPRNRFPPPAADGRDRHLDEARTGPLWLGREEIARLVADSLQHAEQVLSFYRLHAWVIMANHVHLLVSPKVAPVRFLQSIKGYTAREANRALVLTGQPFWQAESYDHWLRDAGEFDRVRSYIENNPVRAGLVRSPEEFRRSSAYAGTNAVVAASKGRSTH